MQVLLKRFSVIVGFSALILVLVAGTAVTRYQLRTQDTNQFWVNHTRQVLFELERTESLLKDAETGQRGFLLTGEDRYLAPYQLAVTQVNGHLDRLAALVADNPRQVQAVAELRGLASAKLAELSDTIAMARAGQTAGAKAEVLTDRGLLIMGSIRQVIDRMEAHEESLEAERTAQYQRSANLTVASIYTGGLIGIAGLALLAYFILREMRLRERHGEEIRVREEWFRVTLTSIGDAVIATDPKGTVTFLNPVAERLIGTSSQKAVGRSIVEVFPIFNEFTGAATENPVRKVIEQGHVVGLANHTVLKNEDGHLIPIEDSAAPICNDQKELIGVVLVFRDVTEDRKAQELMRRSEKLSAAARLSATVAHEINNPLEAVCNLIYLAKLTPGAPPTLVDQLSQAEQELSRVAHITRQTLGFYRESNDPQPVEIAPIIESVLGLYSNKLRSKNITVRRSFDDCPPIIGVPGELRQAIANLLSNAVDAVEEHGTISVTIQCLQDSGQNQIQLVIEDDGPGIPTENMHRIFEPFFTTKKDIGTGLGLYVTREILERHGGSVTVRPRLNGHDVGGACFILRIPCDPDPNARESVLTNL